MSFTTSGGLIVLGLRAHDDVLAPLIHRLKYGDETLIACRLGSALGVCLPPKWQDGTLIPVPLHPKRLAERGYNQSALLARTLGRQARLKVETSLVWRARETNAQARLSGKERAKNLDRAFLASPRVRDHLVILVDDVTTTGSTLESCRDALTAQGACVIGALSCTVARPD